MIFSDKIEGLLQRGYKNALTGELCGGDWSGMHRIKILRCEDSIVGNGLARVNSGNEWIRQVREKKNH